MSVMKVHQQLKKNKAFVYELKIQRLPIVLSLKNVQLLLDSIDLVRFNFVLAARKLVFKTKHLRAYSKHFNIVSV